MSSQALVQCINQFALLDSNPVLCVLPDNKIVKTKQKYPQPMLSFSDMGLRAYYHCHTSDSKPESEHGHFHIFLNADNEWSHIAGLSMDNLGQPIEWFTVNHWVTAETWIPADKIVSRLNQLIDDKNPELDLVEQWLLAMMEFYRRPLDKLLRLRDQRLDKLAQDKNLGSVLKDRTIYDLSRYEINLLSDLESYANLPTIIM